MRRTVLNNKCNVYFWIYQNQPTLHSTILMAELSYLNLWRGKSTVIKFKIYDRIKNSKRKKIDEMWSGFDQE